MKDKIRKEIELTVGLLETIDLDGDIEPIINVVGAAKGLLDNIMYRLIDTQTKKCEHPKEYRLDLSSMGKPPEWECRLCGHHHIEEVT